MSELFWKLRGQHRVISLFRQTDEEISQLIDELNSYQINKYRVFDGVEFEHCFNFIVTEDVPFNLVKLAMFILAKVNPRKFQGLMNMNSELVIIETSRQYLSEHNCLLFITNLESTMDWNLIKQYLICESTRGYIIVITRDLWVAAYCVDHKQDQVLDVEVPMTDWVNRIGLSELFWQLREHHGVISLFGRTDEEISQLRNKLFSYHARKCAIFDGVKFEQCCFYHGTGDGPFKVLDFALFILAKLEEIDGEDYEYKKLMAIYNSDSDTIITESRRSLTEHNCVIFITKQMSTMDWDLIKQNLLCDFTRGYIVVVTRDQSLATHCVDHKQDRVLHVEDLLKDPTGLAHGRGNIQEEVESEPYTTAGDEYNRERVFYDLHAGKKLSVWGIAGLGKSSLVKHHYNKIMLTQVYRMYGWVDVPHPFNLTDLCQRLLLDLLSDDDDAKEAVAIGMFEGQDPIQVCTKILLEHKCLVVFDGLQSTHDWDLINTTLLSQPINGGTIVITREERIARRCSEDNIYNVQGLQAEAAIDLFTKIILNGKPLFPDAVEMSKLILSKCGGLPEVIIAIGKHIRPVAQEKYSLLGILMKINGGFIEYLQSHLPSLSGLFCWLQSYFDSFSDVDKQRIFYMSVFPADQRIRWRRLLRRWIAEGYSPTEEKVVEHAVELMRSSIVYYDGKEISTRNKFKLNGFFLEYIKSQPMEHNRVFELDGSYSPSPQLTGQHLSIRSSWDRDRILFQSLEFPRLRSFTVFGKWWSFLICDKMKLLRVLDLEGTSTPGSPSSVSNDDLEKITELFPRLKFISLRGCIKVTRLPDSMGDMKQLDTLDAKNTSIVELPPAIITKLHKLQYIRVGTIQAPDTTAGTSSSPPTPPQEDGHGGTSLLLRAKIALSTGALNMARHLKESSSRLWNLKDQRLRIRVADIGGGVVLLPAAAQGIGELTELRTLGVVNVSYEPGGLCFLDELRKLSQLRKLALSGITRYNWGMLCRAMWGHRNLEILSLQLLLLEEDSSYDFAYFNEISEPPMTIRRFKVLYTSKAVAGAGCAWVRPTWIKPLGAIRFDHELTVSNQEDIDLLYESAGALPGSDDRLRIKPIEQCLNFHKGLSYDALSIDCHHIISTVTFRGTVTYKFNVRKLNIHCCVSCGRRCLSVYGLQNLRKLEEITVTGPIQDDYERDLRRQLEEHPKNIELKLL